MTDDIQIFLDLDGVIADFERHLQETGQIRKDGEIGWNQLDHDWWATVPETPGAKEFYDAAKKLAKTRFLTAPALHEGCFSGKAKWVQNFVPERGIFILRDLMICSSRDKALVAAPNRILVDDRQSNIDAWIAAGGIGILHKGDFVETLKTLEEEVAKLKAAAVVKKVKPKLITIGGLSGSGKTTLAVELAKTIPNAVHIDSDRTRKELFGVSATTRLPEEAYSSEATKRLNDEMDARTKTALAAGKNVVISATFRDAGVRAHQKELTAESGADFHGIWLNADMQKLFARVAARKNDASDATVDVLQAQLKSPPVVKDWLVIDSGKTPEEVAREVLEAIEGTVIPAPCKADAPKPFGP